MIDAPPPPPPIVLVEDAKTHESTFFFGFMAVGEEAAMKALEKEAKERGFPAGRAKNDKSEVEVIVLFPVGSDSRKALAIYREAAAGRFGPLKLEVTIAPLSAALDGKIDMEKEVTVEPPSAILVPER